MAVFIVTWDFKDNADYVTKRENAEHFLRRGRKAANTSWVIDYEDNAEGLFDDFREAVVGEGKFVRGDRVFIAQITEDHQGWQTKEEFWNWIEKPRRSW